MCPLFGLFRSIYLPPSLFFYFHLGAFGLTSEEKVYAAGGGAYTSYSYVGGIQVQNPVYSPYGTVTKRKPPRPTKWVYFCANEINITDLYSLNWPDVFGPHYRWISRGIVEAIERLSEHGSYDWLRIFPIASKFSLHPRIIHKTDSDVATNKDYLGVEGLYISMTKKISSLVLEQIELATLQSNRPNHSEVIGLENFLQYIPQDEQNEFLALSREWIRAIVLHSPTLSILSKILLDTSIGISRVVCYSLPLQNNLIESFQTKLEDEQMTESDLILLTQVGANLQFLLCPQVAVALLKNSSLDRSIHSVVDLISICLKGKIWRQEEKSDEEKDSLVGLQGIWHELNSAAKGFLCRKHGTEPLPELVQIDEKRENFSVGILLAGEPIIPKNDQSD
jgi:hypothetical protein